MRRFTISTRRKARRTGPEGSEADGSNAAGPSAAAIITRDNLRGMVAMATAMFLLTVNFALVKLAGDTLPVGQIIFLRGAIAALLMGVAIAVTGVHRQIRLILHRTVLLRSVMECLSATLFVTALMVTSLTSATVILQSMPLAITAGAALWLGEVVRWRRWLAIAFGMVGVTIVVRPGLESFEWASLIVVGSVLLSSIRDLSTRRMPQGIPSLLVTVAALGSLSLVGLGMSVFEDWVVPDAETLLQVSGSGALLSLGLFFVVLAMRRGELSIIAPFRYSAVLWAIMTGYLFWGEIPDPLTLLGASIIVSSGVYISYRERARRSGTQLSQADATAGVIVHPDREKR